MNPASDVSPPFSPPDCPWVEMKANSKLPERAVYQNAKLDGENAFIGRVRDGDCFLIGTALPVKGVCLYATKDGEVKSTDTYEILTVDCGDPLRFMKDLNHNLIFVAGSEGDEIFYVGRYVDANGNTYYGWASRITKSVYIPRDPKLGPSKIEENFDVLIHRFLDRLCICPPGPMPGQY